MNKKIIGAVFGIVLGLAIAFAPLPDGLSKEGMLTIAIFACAIVWWMADVVSDYGTAIIMLCAWAICKVAPFNVIFSQYASSTLWIIVGALGLGLAATKSGLLNRIALHTMRKFPLTFNGQALALFITGIFVSPFIPTATAKVGVLAPFARAICENMGYENKSNGAAGLFGALFLSVGLSYPLFLSANFMCYAVLGLCPPEVRAQITWMNWFINALPWGIVTLLSCFLAILKMYKPSETKQINPNFLNEEIAKLGPLSKKEIIVTIVLVCSLIFWMTEPWHQVSSAVVSLLALAVLLLYNVIDRASFRSGIAWDAVIFIGALLNVAAVFKVLKIDAWIGKTFGSYITPLVSGNIFVFLIVLCLFIYAIRLVMVSQITTIAILVLMLTPFAIQAGINPWVVAFSCFVSVHCWYMFYHSAPFLVTYYATGGDMVTHRQTLKLCAVYMVVSILGLLVSVPVWKFTGLIQ